ncbi:MAG: response regulator [Nitrospiraceae bacterium]|nr:MAG: response regulator [Nitrospiraceae bacterium]
MKTVLVIEDNEDNMVLISRLLEKSQYRVLQAGNGQKGIDAAIEHRPDFIILDIQLPDMDGTEVLRSLREKDMTSGIPVIAMTSFAMSGDRERLLASGCNGYIEKPIDPGIVIEQIKKIIKE